MEQLHSIIDQAQDFLWTYINIVLLVGCALFFSLRTRFVQFRLFGDMITQMFSSNKKTEAEGAGKQISSFQAFIVALASRIGTGNLAGVATAISVGGPGAIFWMWVMALFGAATAFVESTLAQLYKRKGEHGFYGGPAYYMLHGLNRKWMGVLFSVLIIITFGFANNAMQSNTIALACQQAFDVPLVVMGAMLCLLTLAVIFGGIQRIANVSSAIVPFMAVAYLGLAIWIVASNLSILPDVLKTIVSEAFGIGQVAGGAIGHIIIIGVKRGLFSNEAGEGSAPNAAATATVSHPVKQGLIQALGVFTDTIVVCSCTAFVILCSGVDYHASDGIQLTQNALTAEIGSIGNTIIAIMIWLFAFSTIIANCYYGETNLLYFSKSRVALFAYRVIAACFVFMGALMTLDFAWSMIDLCMAMITICNLAAIIQLYPKVHRLLRNYLEQRKAGQDPVFRSAMMPGSGDIEAW